MPRGGIRLTTTAAVAAPWERPKSRQVTMLDSCTLRTVTGALPCAEHMALGIQMRDRPRRMPTAQAEGARPQPSVTCRHAAHLSPDRRGFETQGDQMVQVRQNGKADAKPESILRHLLQHVLGLRGAQCLMGPDSDTCTSGCPLPDTGRRRKGMQVAPMSCLLHAFLRLPPLLPWQQKQSLHAPVAMTSVHFPT